MNDRFQAIKIDNTGLDSSEEAVARLASIPFPPDLEIGQSIDQWKVVRIMQTSQRSQVYQVEHADGRKAVMKTPSVNYQDDPAYIERFVMEEWVGSRISNAHVVKTIAPSEHRQFLYYLTEYIPGPTLGELIKERGKLEISDAISIITQVTSGIRAFHRKETLHQDIKPDNVVYGTDGVKIIDFGSALVAGIDEIRAPVEREHALGTLDYSAPEYRMAGPRTEKSDQYSIAVLLYEMLTGKLPFGTAYQKANNQRDLQKLEYISAMKHNPLVPPWMDGAIKKALDLHPNYRYDSLSEFIHDLNHPNEKFLNAASAPLLERNPVLVWQIISGVLLLGNIVLLTLMSSGS